MSYTQSHAAFILQALKNKKMNARWKPLTKNKIVKIITRYTVVCLEYAETTHDPSPLHSPTTDLQSLPQKLRSTTGLVVLNADPGGRSSQVNSRSITSACSRAPSVLFRLVHWILLVCEFTNTWNFPFDVHMTRVRRFAGKDLHMTQQLRLAAKRDHPDNVVGKIVSHQMHKRALYMTCRWRGFTSELDSLQRADSLAETCPAKVREYYTDKHTTKDAALIQFMDEQFPSLQHESNIREQEVTAGAMIRGRIKRPARRGRTLAQVSATASVASKETKQSQSANKRPKRKQTNTETRSRVGSQQNTRRQAIDRNERLKRRNAMKQHNQTSESQQESTTLSSQNKVDKINKCKQKTRRDETTEEDTPNPQTTRHQHNDDDAYRNHTSATGNHLNHGHTGNNNGMHIDNTSSETSGEWMPSAVEAGLEHREHASEQNMSMSMDMSEPDITEIHAEDNEQSIVELGTLEDLIHDDNDMSDDTELEEANQTMPSIDRVTTKWSATNEDTELEEPNQTMSSIDQVNTDMSATDEDTELEQANQTMPSVEQISPTMSVCNGDTKLEKTTPSTEQTDGHQNDNTEVIEDPAMWMPDEAQILGHARPGPKTESKKISTESVTPSTKRQRRQPGYALKTEVRQSTIPGAGDGLFMLETAKKGDRVAVYFGDRLTAEQAKNRDSDYIVKVNKNLYLDARDVLESNKGRYVNHGGPGYTNNARLGSGRTPATCRRTGRPWISIIAQKTIKPGDEIFMPYGKGWIWPWQNRAKCKRMQHMQVQAQIIPGKGELDTTQSNAKSKCTELRTSINRKLGARCNSIRTTHKATGAGAVEFSSALEPQEQQGALTEGYLTVNRHHNRRATQTHGHPGDGKGTSVSA